MNPGQDQYVNVGDLRTRYWTLGHKGPIAILIHGLGGYIETWGKETLERLAMHNQVIALDLPGHGLSDLAPEFSFRIADFATFVRAFMDALGLPVARVIGHSLGGAIAAHFALAFPDRAQSLVLVSSAGWGREIHPFFRLASLPGLGEWLTRPSRSGTDGAVKVLVRDPSAKTQADRELDYEMAMRPGSRRAFLATLRAFCDVRGQRPVCYQSLLSAVGRLGTPMLVVWGRYDQIIPARHAAIVAERALGSSVHILDECGHRPMLEHPADFCRVLQTFFDGSAAA